MKSLHIRKSMTHLGVSPIWGLVPLAQKAEEKGIQVHHLNIGNPNMVVPEHIKYSLQNIAEDIKRIPYPFTRGQRGLLESWKKYFSDIHIPIHIQHEDMLITAGASGALYITATALFDKGDEYLLFEPFYPSYLTCGIISGAKPVGVELDKTNKYHLPKTEKIIEKITSKTKAIFLTYPSNPTGTVFSRKEVELILKIAQEHNLFVISDEAYRGIVFDNRESLSILHIATPEQLPHIIVIDSLSKRLNVCGARIGLILSKNQEFMQAVVRIGENLPQVPYIEQEVVAGMLSDALGYIEWLRREYEKKRNIFLSTFEQEMGETYAIPEGAFYAMLQLPIDNDINFVKWLLNDFSENGETVMVSPGSGFYVNPKHGEKEVRIAYILDEKELEKSAVLLAHGVKKYGK